MDKKMFQNIEGMEHFWNAFPNKPWSYFHDIVEFRWYKEFDYEEWYDRWYVELKMSSIDGKDVILFSFKDVRFITAVSMIGWISGLDIINKSQDYQTPTYEIIDFEDGRIHMMCRDFSIKVIQAAGVSIEE